MTDWTGQQNWAAAARGARPVHPTDQDGGDLAAEPDLTADPWAALRQTPDGSTTGAPVDDAGSILNPATAEPAMMRGRLPIFVTVAIALALAAVVLGALVWFG